VAPLQVITQSEAMAAVVTRWKSEGDTVALVPTMGFLHEGHGALMRAAASGGRRVVVSIFVNPLQFAAGEDFERYPRNAEHDRAFLEAQNVDVVFMPGVDQVYPGGIEAATVVGAGEVGELFDGATRPGHFDGVLTVVHRLFELVSPDVAVFGKKDAQQLFLIEQMVAARQLPIDVLAIDTVRAPDGLALSSRNSYLSATERQRAVSIPEALELAAQEATPLAATQRVRTHLENHEGVNIDYVDTVDPQTFLPCTEVSQSGQALLIVAVKVGNTRLIDNRLLSFPQ
jgi:pantoate--beta-alanine ligase